MLSKLFPMHSRPSFWSALLVIAALCGLYAPPSLAVAIYSGNATAELRITSIVGDATLLACTACTDTISDTFFVGSATATATGFANTVPNPPPANLGVGDGLSLRAEVSGSASNGFADSFFHSFGVIDLSNAGTADITVTFELVWSLFAEASIIDPLNEDAAVRGRIEVDTDSGSQLDERVRSDVLFGPFGPQSDGSTISFSLTIPGGEEDFVDILLRVSGLAEAAAVPEPGALPLIALGLAGLGFFARRRKTS